MSVAKSFIATGIGIAVDEGLIEIQRPMTDYVPALTGSAYDGVRVKDVLQMSSGAAWNEGYNDPDSDIERTQGNLKPMMMLAIGSEDYRELRGRRSTTLTIAKRLYYMAYRRKN
jgi:CubicO group peptidase (beta-lactamase class C family)